MGTGLSLYPIIVFETADDPYFQREQISEVDLRIMLNPESSFIERTRAAVKIVGYENFPPRHLINFILAARGKIKYWAQDAYTAKAVGTAVAQMIFYVANGVRPKSEVVIPFPQLMLDRKQRNQLDAKLLKELRSDFPDVINPDKSSTLKDAAYILFVETFGEIPR